MSPDGSGEEREKKERKKRKGERKRERGGKVRGETDSQMLTL